MVNCDNLLPGVSFRLPASVSLRSMSPVTLLTLTMMISHVHCSEWERMYDGQWRAEGPATIYLEDGGALSVARVDVARGTELEYTLEDFCRTDLDGGSGDTLDN